jgi:hypothetical protein
MFSQELRDGPMALFGVLLEYWEIFLSTENLVAVNLSMIETPQHIYLFTL